MIGPFTKLLVVLVAALFLAGILVPLFFGLAVPAPTKAAKVYIKSCEIALAAYRNDMGTFPVGTNGLTYLITAPATKDSNWHGPYLKLDPLRKDPWGKDYVYRCPGVYNTGSYDLFSMGRDGKIGGGDDITNWQKK